MNKLFIIGNGFDLAHDLKSSYCDFIFWLFNREFDSLYESKDDTHQNELFSITRNSKVNIKLTLNTLKNFNSILKQHHIEITFKNEFFKRIVSQIEANNWVDIETYYYRYLKSIVSNNTMQDPINSVIKLNNCLDTITLELIKYLTEVSSKITTKNNIWEHFDREKENSMKDYFKDSLMCVDLFVTFNYTDSISKYIKTETFSDFLSREVIHIHGELKNMEENPIIFGYGDEMDDYYKSLEKANTNEYLKHMKSFGYFKSENYEKLLRFVKDKNYEVHIMGHSCGISDRVLLNSIFENDNCQKIKIYYHDKGNKQNDYIEKTMNISRQFNNKEKLRERIIPITKCVPL